MDLATTYTIKAKVTGQESLNGLNKSLGRVKESSNRAATAFNKLKSAGNSLMGVLGSVGATAAVTGFIKAGVDMQRTQKTLKILTEEYGEHQQVLDFVSTAADRFGIGQHTATEGVSDLFARLRPMGISLEQIKDTYLGLNNAALRYNLSAHDLAGVQLQLGQALGSGVLQGDEFRSIMERLPAIGQAVADVMGVQVGELKQLSSDGELTTEVIIQAMQKLKDMDVPPPDAFRLFRKEMENLSVIIGTKLLPAFTPVVQFIGGLLEKFSNLPAPLQTIIAAVTAASAGLVIIAPALGLIVTGIGAIGTVIGAVLPFLAPILAGGAIPLAIVGLGALIFKFRDQIGQAFAAIGQFIYAPFQPFVEFVGNIFSSAINMAHNAFGRLPAVVQNAVKAATAPLRGFIKFLKGILSLLARVRREKKRETGSGTSSGGGSAPTTTTRTTTSSTPSSTSGGSLPSIPSTSSLPSIPSSSPNIPIPSIPSSSASIPSSTPSYPDFSSGSSGKKGGYGMSGQDLSPQNLGVDLYDLVSGFTASGRSSTRLGYYENPDGSVKIFQHLASQEEKRQRQQNAINRKTGIKSNKKPPNVNIQTGEVRNFEGTNYVTTSDLQNAVQSGVMQTMNYLEADGVRYNLGM